MGIPVRQTSNTSFEVGPQVENTKIRALQEGTPDANEIFENMEAYNEEIEEIPQSEPAAAPAPRIPKKERTVSSPVARPGRRSRAAMTQGEPEPEAPVVQEQEDSFDDMLERVDEDTEATPDSLFVSEEQKKETMLGLLKNLPNSPSDRQIAAWKGQHGENGLQLIAFDEKTVFIYTFLTAGQWRKVQEKIQELVDKGNSNAEEALKQKVVQYCVKWPALTNDFFVMARAGILDSLYQAIWTESYFLNPQQVQMLTVQL